MSKPVSFIEVKHTEDVANIMGIFIDKYIRIKKLDNLDLVLLTFRVFKEPVDSDDLIADEIAESTKNKIFKIPVQLIPIINDILATALETDGLKHAFDISTLVKLFNQSH